MKTIHKETVPNESAQTEKAKGKRKVVKNKGKQIAVDNMNDANAMEGREEEKISRKKKRHETMKLKISPRHIVEVMQALNAEQLAAVKEMGFGELVHYGITEIPGKMAYDLLNDFDDVNSSIQFETRQSQKMCT